MSYRGPVLLSDLMRAMARDEIIGQGFKYLARRIGLAKPRA